MDNRELTKHLKTILDTTQREVAQMETYQQRIVMLEGLIQRER